MGSGDTGYDQNPTAALKLSVVGHRRICWMNSAGETWALEPVGSQGLGKCFGLRLGRLGENHRVDALERCEGLTQATAGKQSTASPWVFGRKDHQVDVAKQTEVRKAVVEQKQVGFG
jgi:hypothetical protein